jgi:hypothetical protein
MEKITLCDEDIDELKRRGYIFADGEWLGITKICIMYQGKK